MRVIIFYMATDMLHTAPKRVSAQIWEFGVNFGGSGFMGNINPHNVLYFKHAGEGLHTKYNLDATWQIRFDANFAKLEGSDTDAKDEYQKTRNLSFDNNIVEVSLIADFSFLDYLPGMIRNRDKLDNVSGLYTNLVYEDLPPFVKNRFDKDTWQYWADPREEPAYSAGGAQGSTNIHDAYMTLGVTITYSILSMRCY